MLLHMITHSFPASTTWYVCLVGVVRATEQIDKVAGDESVVVAVKREVERGCVVQGVGTMLAAASRCLRWVGSLSL